MEHALEFHTALIAISSTFMAVAGIIVAILISRKDGHERVHRLCILLVLMSVGCGAISVVFGLSWFSAECEALTLLARLGLMFQSLLLFVPLGVLMRRL